MMNELFTVIAIAGAAAIVTFIIGLLMLALKWLGKQL